jgi:hypothetical protein
MSDLLITRGDTPTFNIAVTLSGAVYDLTGCTIWFTAKFDYANTDAQAVFQRSTLNGGIVITNGPQGLAQANLLSTDTSALANTKTMLLWDCQVKSALGQIYTVAKGNLIVEPDVTRTI